MVARGSQAIASVIRFPRIIETAANTFINSQISLWTATNVSPGTVFEIFTIRLQLQDLRTSLPGATDEARFGVYTGNAKTSTADTNLSDSRVIISDSQINLILTSGGNNFQTLRTYDMQAKDGQGYMIASNTLNMWVAGVSATAANSIEGYVIGRYRKINVQAFNQLFIQQQGAV